MYEMQLMFLNVKGDILSSEVANVIPPLAIFYALISSMNSVGVSIYQEQLFKVIFTKDQGILMFVCFQTVFKQSFSIQKEAFFF